MLADLACDGSSSCNASKHILGCWRSMACSWCPSCDPDRARYMVTCPDCGNKRCPKATHHDNACTGSNDPGQSGGSIATEAQRLAHEQRQAAQRGILPTLADEWHEQVKPSPSAAPIKTAWVVEFDDRSDDGALLVGPFPTKAEGRAWLARQTFDYEAIVVPMEVPDAT